MGAISVEKMDHLFWLGRYTDRVYTTVRLFFQIYDNMIEQPEGIYEKYCERLNIPNIYTSNGQFVRSYLLMLRIRIPYSPIWSGLTATRWFSGRS